MAVSPPIGAPAPLPTLPGPRRFEESARTRPAAQPGRVRPPVTTSPGVLVGRPDLSDAAVLKAVAERMAFEGRDAAKAPAILKAALAGRPVACAFMRRLVLPPPQSKLQMPVQSILREPAPADETKGSWLSRRSLNR